jgi:hypothetical protein
LKLSQCTKNVRLTTRPQRTSSDQPDSKHIFELAGQGADREQDDQPDPYHGELRAAAAWELGE